MTEDLARWSYANGGGTGLVRHGACGLIWWQSGNYTSHCPVCHRTFTSLRGFDTHQRLDTRGRITCNDPSLMKDTCNRDVYTVVLGTHKGETVDAYFRWCSSLERT